MSDQALDDLLLHDKTRRQLLSFAVGPAPGLLINGPPGSGKITLAAHLAAVLLGIPLEKLSAWPYFRHLTKPKDKQEISIDEIRRLNGFLSLKIPGQTKNQIERVVLIEDAHFLSHEAQNSLLKALEEPPASTAFILTATGGNYLLPTVVSRLQRIMIAPVNLQTARDYFQPAHQLAAIDSAWRLAAGAPGLLSGLLTEDVDHPLKQAVSAAKEILGGNAYTRLLIFNRLASDKAEFGLVLDALNRSLSALQQSAVAKQNHPRSNKILANRRLVAQAADALSQNVSPRLISLKLALNLSI